MKKIDETESERRIAYEVSVSKLEYLEKSLHFLYTWCKIDENS